MSTPSVAEATAAARRIQAVVAEFGRVAREHGYAIGEHGSRERDYDLIACPWTDEAADAETLVQALTSVEGVLLKEKPSRVDGTPRWPEKFPRHRPHGRLTWVFLFAPAIAGGPRYIDLSVMPLLLAGFVLAGQDTERLREALAERDAAKKEADLQMGDKLDAQMALLAITKALALELADLGNGWTEATPKILARIETIVDEAERAFRERDAALASEGGV